MPPHRRAAPEASLFFRPGTPSTGGALEVEGLEPRLVEAVVGGMQRAHQRCEAVLGAAQAAYPVRVELSFAQVLERAGPGACVEGLVGPGAACDGARRETALVRLRALRAALEDEPAAADPTPRRRRSGSSTSGDGPLAELGSVAGHELAHHLMERRIGPLACNPRAELVVECLAWALADPDGQSGVRVPGGAGLWQQLPRETAELSVNGGEDDLALVYGRSLARALASLPEANATVRRRRVCAALGRSLLDNCAKHRPQVPAAVVVRLLLSGGLRWAKNRAARRPPFPKGELPGVRNLARLAELPAGELGGAARLSMAAAALSAGDNAGPDTAAPSADDGEALRLARARGWLSWWVVAAGLPDDGTRTPGAQWLMGPERLPGPRPPAPDGLLAVLGSGQDCERAAVQQAAAGRHTWEGRVLWARVAARLLVAPERSAGCVPLQPDDRVHVYVTQAALAPWQAAASTLLRLVSAAGPEGGRGATDAVAALPLVIPFDGRWDEPLAQRSPTVVVSAAAPEPQTLFRCRLQAGRLPLLGALFQRAVVGERANVDAWEQTPHAVTGADGRRHEIGPPLSLAYQEGAWAPEADPPPGDGPGLIRWVEDHTRSNELLSPLTHLLACTRFGFLEPV